MYIADSGKKIWMRYRVQSDGSVTDGALFLDASYESATGRARRYPCDKNGNLYGAGPGACGLFVPKGNTSHNQSPRDRECAWGDKNSKTLYITACTSVYCIKLRVSGSEA